MTSQSSGGGPGSASSTSPWLSKLKFVGSGQHWAVTPCGPFYLMSPEPYADSALTGSTNLIEHYGLEGSYHRFCGKRLREELSSFLPGLSGNVDVGVDAEPGSGLQSLIERPPIGKELMPIHPSQAELAFRLHPGPLSSAYSQLFSQPSPSLRHRTGGERKKRRDLVRDTTSYSAESAGSELTGGPAAGPAATTYAAPAGAGLGGIGGPGVGVGLPGGVQAAGSVLSKTKKRKPEDDEKRKKKKKEKKKRKEKD